MKRVWIAIGLSLLLIVPVWANDDDPMPEYQPPPEYSEQYEGPEEPYEEPYYEPPREPKSFRRRHKAKRIIRKVRKVLDVIEAFVDNPEVLEGFLK